MLANCQRLHFLGMYRTLFYFILSRGKIFYRIDLASPLDGGKDVKVTVETAYSHSLVAYPAEIAQSEKQLVKFTFSAYLYSPYKVTKQTSTVKCASSSIESYTKTVKPTTSSDAEITYGPYENKEAFSEVKIA